MRLLNTRWINQFVTHVKADNNKGIIMDINTYLHYNNVQLIDPEDEFQASCIKQFYAKGYLSPNQLLSLRNWAHSIATIERLTAGTIPATSPQVTPTVSTAEAKVKPTNARWTKEEVESLLNTVESGTTSIDELSSMFNRKDTSIQNALYRNSSECVVRKGKVVSFERIPF